MSQDKISRFRPAPEKGLSGKQVQERIRQGLQNQAPPAISKSIRQIFQENICTLFNLFNVLIALALALVGAWSNMVFILIIAVLVQLVEIILKKFMPPLYKALGVYLPLITTNCAVLGVTISVLDEGYNFAESLVCAVGAGVGFMVAMVLFSGVRKRLEDAQPPKCFEGLPITLVAASVTSLSFMGFGGVIENIFAGH